MGLFSIGKKYTATGRRLARKEKGFQKAEYKARLADIESDIGFRAKEDPREQTQLKGSLFGRGLGKSSIATQNMARLTDMQARRMAVLRRRHELAVKGIDLIKLRAKAARRFMPFDIADDILAVTSAFATGGMSIPFTEAADSVSDKLDPSNFRLDMPDEG